MNVEPETRPRISFLGFISICAGVIILQALIGLIIYWRINDWGERANFGEMFGAVNTLFSGLAFAGVIYAVLLQRQELELQRTELELTRLELHRSAEAQEKSEKALAQQAKLMSQTARLSSMNLMLEAIKNKIDLMRSEGYGPAGKSYQAEKQKYLRQYSALEALIREIEESTERTEPGWGS